MIDAATLALFIPTFFIVAVTPGMCMTLAMALGMSVGIKRTMWMMQGEMLGVAVLCTFAVAGVSQIMLNYPLIFEIFKYIGGAYLIYLGIQGWRSKGQISLASRAAESSIQKSRIELFSQGLFTSLLNPKGWAFMIALLPPFINPSKPMLLQSIILIFIIVCCEFVCMTMYAMGGKSLRLLLQKRNNIKLINRITGTVIILVGIWLAFG